MGAPLDITGQRFNRLTAMGLAPNGRKGARAWLCRCDCGNQIVAEACRLRRGSPKSCGCQKREVSSAARTRWRHGFAESPTHNTWLQMRGRCHRPSHNDFHRYGARGIRVCDRWRYSFEAFLADMGERPTGTSIDRIDNNGNYEPGNCRWATTTEQAQNRRTTRLVTYKGEAKCISQFAKDHGIEPRLLRERLDSGWRIDEALTRRKAKGVRCVP